MADTAKIDTASTSLGAANTATMVSVAASLPANTPVYFSKSNEWPIVTLDQLGVLRSEGGERKPVSPGEVGVVRIGLRWIAKKASKSPIQVKRLVSGTNEQAEPDHELVQIWNASNPVKLVQRILDDLYIYGKGNALLEKVREPNSKRVMRLSPLNIQKCNYDKTLRIWKYDSRALLPDNLVWISLGADPEDPALGVDQWAGFEHDLRTLKGETEYTADVLENAGVMGLFVTRDDPNMVLSEDAKKRIERETRAMTTGKKRGSTFVSGTSLKVTEVGSGPEKMALDRLTLGAQSRVAGNMQLALMVLGLNDPGKTYSNLREANRGSYQTAVISFHDLLAEALSRQLLPDTGYDPALYEVEWDYTDAEELQEDLDLAMSRVIKLVGGPVLTPNEGREKLGEIPLDDPAADQLKTSGGLGLQTGGGA